MTAKTKFKSSAFEAIHSAANGLHKAKVIRKITMREFDAACIEAPKTMEPSHVMMIRSNLKLSRPVFARYLNTTESTVQKWESGDKRPSAMAAKLLSVVEKHGLKVLA